MANRAAENREDHQLVTFRLGHELYGIDIARVQEVTHYREVTVLPNAPAFIEGVIDLRGRVVPVVDLKRRLGLEGPPGRRRRIVVVDVSHLLGIIVDDISKVLRLDRFQYEPVPRAAVEDEEASCVESIAKPEDGSLILVVKVDRILTQGERDQLGRLGREREP